MSGSGRDCRRKLTIPPSCVFVRVSVSFLHFSFVVKKINIAVGEHCTLFSPEPRLCLAQNKKVDLISSPRATLPHLSCLLLMAPIMRCVLRGRTVSPGRLLCQCQRNAQAALLNPSEIYWNGLHHRLKRDAKRSPVTRDSQRFFVPCTNFLL